MPNTADVAEEQLRLIWRATGLPKTGLDQVRLDVGAPTLPTSYQVAAMASAAIVAAGATSAEIWRLRTGEGQDVTMNSRLLAGIPSDYGALRTVRHPAILSRTPARDDLEPMPYPR